VLAPANQIALPSCGICDIEADALAIIAIGNKQDPVVDLVDQNMSTASIVAIVPMPRGNDQTRPGRIVPPKGPSLSDGRKTIVVKITHPYEVANTGSQN
jgi:hypothetical protein